MDRYVRRELRAGGATEHPQVNQLATYSTGTCSPEQIFYRNYAAEYPNMQRVNNGAGFMGVAHVNTPTFTANNYQYGQGHVVSGIDSTYLASCSTNNLGYIAPGQQALNQFQNSIFGSREFGAEYQNRNFVGVDSSINATNTGLQQFPCNQQKPETWNSKGLNTNDNQKIKSIVIESTDQHQVFKEHQNQDTWKFKELNTFEKKNIKSTATESSDQQQVFKAPNKKTTENDSQKNELQLPTMTRMEKVKALYESGPRVFIGPVEKVLKWHKALQDIGLLVIYKIVAKCVNVRPGESCAKNLVLRDESGPAIQVVYYEVEFCLPELKPNSTVRVIGRMMPGTCRLQAYNVRPATADDVAMLPRQAAAASYYVAKLSKEYGINTTKA